MNLIWALLQNHHGTTNDLGSLSHFFWILDSEKTCLRWEHPDYHTLLSTLMQILNGLLWNAWWTEYGLLEDYAKSKPGPDKILQNAHVILNKYATQSASKCSQILQKNRGTPMLPQTQCRLPAPIPVPNLILSMQTPFYWFRICLMSQNLSTQYQLVIWGVLKMSSLTWLAHSMELVQITIQWKFSTFS